MDFDFTVIPELQEETDKIVDQMSKSWWLTPNEKRAAMSYGINDEDKALNNYYIPANLLPLEIEDNQDLEKSLHNANKQDNGRRNSSFYI